MAAVACVGGMAAAASSPIASTACTVGFGCKGSSFRHSHIPPRQANVTAIGNDVPRLKIVVKEGHRHIDP